MMKVMPLKVWQWLLMQLRIIKIELLKKLKYF